MIVKFNSYNSNYMYLNEYQNYIENREKNEKILASYLKQYIPVNEAAYKNIQVMTEGTVTNKLKAKFNKFIEFIKNLLSKFMESMTNLFTSEKTYLEKYKDIILKKKPKDIDYSYTGNYEEGIKRCIETQIPVFNYNEHGEALKSETDADAVNVIMKDKSDFKYDEGDTLANNFKNYFLAIDKGQSTGKFSDLNFTDMYNFCMNFNKIKEIKDKDERYLEQSTNEIIKYASLHLNDNSQTQAQNNNQNTSSQNNNQSQNNTSQSNTNTQNNNQNTSSQSTSAQNASYIFNNKYNTYIKEDQDNNNNNSKASPKPNLNINTNAISSMGSHSNDRTQLSDDQKSDAAKGSEDETEQSILKIGNKWTEICRCIIAAKCTAVEQIAKDYMKIIRAHVRSYVGNSKDNTTDKSPSTPTDYNNNSNNGKKK